MSLRGARALSGDEAILIRDKDRFGCTRDDKDNMVIQDLFEVGEIMENENKSVKIKVLDGDDCIITGKALNKYKIILHMKRESDGSEGNVFVKLKDGDRANFPTSKRLLASKNIVGLTLNKFKEMDIEQL